MIWTAGDNSLTVKYDKNGIKYFCEIARNQNGYFLRITHKTLSDNTENDMLIPGNKTKDLVEYAEKFLETT